jgi:hypothetical protein
LEFPKQFGGGFIHCSFTVGDELFQLIELRPVEIKGIGMDVKVPMCVL